MSRHFLITVFVPVPTFPPSVLYSRLYTSYLSSVSSPSVASPRLLSDCSPAVVPRRLTPVSWGSFPTQPRLVSPWGVDEDGCVTRGGGVGRLLVEILFCSICTVHESVLGLNLNVVVFVT